MKAASQFCSAPFDQSLNGVLMVEIGMFLGRVIDRSRRVRHPFVIFCANSPEASNVGLSGFGGAELSQNMGGNSCKQKG